MNGSRYWRIFAEEVPSDLGIDLSPEQVNSLEDALVGAYENYGLHSGKDVADANWRAAETRRLQASAMDRVFRHIEECVQRIERGPSFFGSMSHDQKLAMHELFQAREFVK